VNHTRFPKEDHLPDWARRDNKVTKGDRVESLDIKSTGEIKYPGRTWKLTYDGLPAGNQDLAPIGNCKWEAALAKLTIGGEEVIGWAIDEKPTG